jgi:hypothetical protein
MTAAHVLHRGHERLKPLIDFALKEGWEVLRTPAGNVKLTKQGLSPICTGSTAGDHRPGRNALARMRRADRMTRPRAMTGKVGDG